MTIGINQKTTPLRYLFLIQPDNEGRFVRAMKVAYMLWGGINSPIFPFYVDLPDKYRFEFDIDIPTKEFYRNTINNYDPDIILVDEDLDKSIVSLLGNDREIIEIGKHLNNITDKHSTGISILEISEYLYRSAFKFVRTDGMKFSIPKVGENDLLLQAEFGCISEEMRHEINRLFDGIEAFEEIETNWATIDKLDSYRINNLTAVNQYKLGSWAEKAYLRGSAIYFIDSTSIQDVMNYWNLRAAGWQIVPFPTNVTDCNYFTSYAKLVIEFNVNQIEGLFAIVRLLASRQIDEEFLSDAISKLQPKQGDYSKQVQFSFQSWFPRFWQTKEILEADHIVNHIPYFDVHSSHYESEDDILEFNIKPLSFEIDRKFSWFAGYKTILSFSFSEDQHEYAEALDGITTRQLMELIQPRDFRQWRISRSGIHRRIINADERVSITLPTSIEYLKSYFSNKSYKLEETANSRLAKEVLKNIGGLNGTRYFLMPDRLKIIELFEAGEIKAYSTLLSEIKRQTSLVKNEQAKYFIRKLLENKIIESGLEIKCAVCGQHGFFLLNQLSEKLTCPVCRNQFGIPMNDPALLVWSYRGIGPFSRSNKADGVMSVFATLRLFKDEFNGFDQKISTLFGFALTKVGAGTAPKPKEVDLGIVLQNDRDSTQPRHLLFCECKTYKLFNETDIERMKSLGDDFPGSVLIFATLNTELHEKEVELIRKLVSYFRTNGERNPRNRVLILTERELLSNNGRGSFDRYKDQIKPYHKNYDYLATICEWSLKEHLSLATWGEYKAQQIVTQRAQIGLIIHSLQSR